MPTGPRSVSEPSAGGITGSEVHVDSNGRGNGHVKIVHGFSFDERKVSIYIYIYILNHNQVSSMKSTSTVLIPQR